MAMDAMGDALKRKAGALKGPASPADSMMDDDADMAAPGGAIDLSKIDPAIIEAVAKMLQSGDAVGVDKLGSAAGEVPDGSDKAPSLSGGGEAPPVDRNAVLSAIADGGQSGDSGSLRARAAIGAKAHMNGKHK